MATTYRLIFLILLILLKKLSHFAPALGAAYCAGFQVLLISPVATFIRNAGGAAFRKRSATRSFI